MRTLIPIDWKQVEAMLYAYNDGTDIADILGIHVDTLTRRCEEEHPDHLPFSELKARCRANTRQRLRAAQIMKAMGTEYETEETSVSDGPFGRTTTVKKKTVKVLPDTTMQIFLGKNILGQSEKVDVAHEILGFNILGDKPEGMETDLDD